MQIMFLSRFKVAFLFIVRLLAEKSSAVGMPVGRGCEKNDAKSNERNNGNDVASREKIERPRERLKTQNAHATAESGETAVERAFGINALSP
ncbi:MAG: hypothetical protein J6K25_02840 [Thermoguttaceae bacterium]|nr:hypothetical protein [Thermoguttaceae bacterium]